MVLLVTLFLNFFSFLVFLFFNFLFLLLFLLFLTFCFVGPLPLSPAFFLTQHPVQRAWVAHDFVRSRFLTIAILSSITQERNALQNENCNLPRTSLLVRDTPRLDRTRSHHPAHHRHPTCLFSILPSQYTPSEMQHPLPSDRRREQSNDLGSENSTVWRDIIVAQGK